MKTILISFTILTILIFSACCKKDNFKVCFTVDNPIMALGDTVKLHLCINNRGTSNWNMGDGTTYNNTTSLPKHVYKAKGTFIIKLQQTAHHEGIYICKPAEAEAQQTVTVQ